MKRSLLALLLVLPVPAYADCPASGEGITITPDDLLVAVEIRFDLYRSVIDAASMPVIDAVARRLRACPELAIEIQVHTDTRRAEQFNLRASQLIAVQIRDRLIAQGVPASRVAACGYGESRPSTAGGREPWDPANTRVEWRRVPDAARHRCPL